VLSFSESALLNPMMMETDPHIYTTVAGYSSINRNGPIMGNAPNKASEYSGLLEKLRKDFEVSERSELVTTSVLCTDENTSHY